MNDLISTFGSVFYVLLAFSALVFVHELGHYLAARFVGVRVERFFVGFDAWGMKISRTINNVEYGIGVLPLGGYVKLAGQADDPREEEVTGAPDELRSQPLWGQALIMVAGVTMNLIFGFLILVVAYLYGIKYEANILGDIDPNTPAAQADLLPGDRVVSIDGSPMRGFLDIKQHIVSNPRQRFKFIIQREGEKEKQIRFVNGIPQETGRGKLNAIGVKPPISPKIGYILDRESISPEFQSLFKNGDVILSINDTPIGPYQGHKIDKIVQPIPGSKVKVVIQRDDQEKTLMVRIPYRGKYGPLYDVGLRFYLRVRGTRPESPARKAGLKPGDLIYGVRTTPESEVQLLRGTKEFLNLIQESYFKPVDLAVDRLGKRVEIKGIAPRFMHWHSQTLKADRDTLLGIQVKPNPAGKGFEIVKILSGSPLEGKVDMGDLIVSLARSGKPFNPVVLNQKLGAQIDKVAVAPIDLMVCRGGIGAPKPIKIQASTDFDTGQTLLGVDFALDNRISAVLPTIANGLPSLVSELAGDQAIPVDSYLTGFSFSHDLRTTILAWHVPATDTQEARNHRIIMATPDYVRDAPGRFGFLGFFPFNYYVATNVHKAESVGAAMSEAANRGIIMGLTIYDFVYKLIRTDLPFQATGGPISVFRVISAGVEKGFGYYLFIIAFISINLAIFNLLPFPVLDGGHLVFLLIEWVKGSPPSIRIREIAQYIGIACLLSLMLAVTYFDVKDLF